MKPVLKHKMYGDGVRFCGDITKNIYISDEEYCILPECPKCFEISLLDEITTHGPLIVERKENTELEMVIPRKRFLRDYLINNE
jgi:hypothetical protein